MPATKTTHVRLLSRPLLVSFTRAQTILACDVATLYAAAAMTEHDRCLGGVSQTSTITQPDALWVARLALIAQETATPPKPLYLRAPDARLAEAQKQ